MHTLHFQLHCTAWVDAAQPRLLAASLLVVEAHLDQVSHANLGNVVHDELCTQASVQTHARDDA
jgi:hypothetical protein